MACCNSYTECNELITIEYLKNFIGTLIQDSNGNTVTISTTSADTYCPTYDEIKALLPAHSKGVNGPLDDVDGIVLNGTGNSTVKQQELSIEYTRWKSFTISANPTTIGQCGGSTSFSYVNTFTRYKKSMDNNCDISTTNEDKKDTQNSRVTFTTSKFGTISNHSMTVGENPHGTSGTAPARSTVVTGHVTFRGSEKTNTVTITQQALGGEYRYWYVDHGNSYSYGLTCTSTIPYTGGTATATGSYKVDYWDVYKWWDDCKHDFPNKTQNRNNRVSSFTESAGSHTFKGLPCDGKGGSYTFTYHGKTCTTTQDDNPNPCQDCPPKNYTSYTDVTVDCTAGSATVNGVWHHFTGGQLDDQGNCIGYTEETGNTSYTKYWNCDTTGGWIDAHINVTGAPCCSEYCEYTFDDVEIPCDAAAATSKDVKYTEVCHHADGTTSSTTGTSSVSIPAVSCNSGNDNQIQARVVGRSLATSKPKITQKGGCTCPCLNPSTTVTIADVEIPCDAAAATTKNVSYTSVTTYSNCETETVTDTTTVNIPAVECNSGNDKEIQAGNTGTTVATAKPKITQKGGCTCCRCSDLTLGKTSESWAYNVTTSKDITITSASCVTGIAISSPTHFNATLGTNKVTVSPKGNNTSLSDYVDTLTVTYNGSCSSAITLTQYYQPPVPCTCNDLTVSPTSLEFDWDGASMSQRVDITSAACVTNIQASCQGGTFFSMMGQDCVYVDVDDNTTTRTLTGTLTITYNNNCSSAVTLTQTPRPTCNDFTYSDIQIHNGVRIPTSVSMSFDLVRVTGPSYNDVASIGVTTTGNVTLVERERVADGQIFVVRFPTVSSPEVATITLYYNGNVCREYEIFRVCPCGTDDCESNLGGGYIINNEINADSWVLGNDGSTSFTYNGVSYPYRYMNGDSLCCDPSKVQVVSDSGDKYLAASTYIADGNGNNYHLGGWSAITNGGNVMVGYRPGTGTDTDYGMITYTLLTNNYTTSRKDYSVTFKVDAGTPLGKNSPIYNQLWPNATVCTQFTVNIRQAPSGGQYDRHGGCQPNQYGVARRKLVANTGPCWPGQENNRQIIIDNNHSCMLPPFSPDSYH
jgi:hypothetical protein